MLHLLACAHPVEVVDPVAISIRRVLAGRRVLGVREPAHCPSGTDDSTACDAASPHFDLSERRRVARRAVGRPWSVEFPAAVEVTLTEGTLVEDDGSGLTRRPVDGPVRASLFDDGTLVGDGFLARLVGARPHAWLAPGRTDDAVRALVPTRVDVYGVRGDRVVVGLPFDGPDGGPMQVEVSAGRLSAGPPAAATDDGIGIYGQVEAAGERVAWIDRDGAPIGWTRCGPHRRAGAHVLQVAGGLEYDGPAGEVVPCAAPAATREALPRGWTAAPRTPEEATPFAAALFRQGRTLYTRDGDRCVAWTVEGEALVRRWDDAEHEYAQTIDLDRNGRAFRLERHPVRERPKRPTAIESIGGDPILPCGPPPAQLVDWDDDRVEFVRVYAQGEPLWGWPDTAPVEALFLTAEACADDDRWLARATFGAAGCG